MKKTVLILMILVMAMGIMTACRENTDGQSGTTTPSTTAATKPMQTVMPTVTVPESGPMDPTAGAATDADGIIGQSDPTKSSETGSAKIW